KPGATTVDGEGFNGCATDPAWRITICRLATPHGEKRKRLGMESTKEAEGVGLDDLLSLRRPLTVLEIASLWPRFALAAQRLIDSLAGRAAQVAELEQRARSAELLTAEQAAQRLAVPESFVRQAGRDGRIQAVNVGSYVRFAPSEI